MIHSITIITTGTRRFAPADLAAAVAWSEKTTRFNYDVIYAVATRDGRTTAAKCCLDTKTGVWSQWMMN